jgi:penicillin G amidase
MGHHAQEWLRRLMVRPEDQWFNLGNGETLEEVLTLALRWTRNFLKDALGPDEKDWMWGRMHQVSFKHVLGKQRPLDMALNRGPYPVGATAVRFSLPTA